MKTRTQVRAGINPQPEPPKFKLPIFILPPIYG